MKKTTKTKPEKHPVITKELHFRLSELESELRSYPEREPGERLLKAVDNAAAATIGKEAVIQFTHHKNTYAAGHTDMTYAGSNHARGVRHIRFYAGGTAVLDIEGDFEDQQFGSNFRFQTIELYTPGDWETDLITLTDELRHHLTKRKMAFKKKRDALHARR